MRLFWSRLIGRGYWLVRVNNTEVKLFWHTAYHHDYARNLALHRHEPELLKKWEARAMCASVIVDAGAYNGIYGLIAAKANPAAKVIILEPDPINVAHVNNNIQQNKLTNVTVIPKVLAGQVGTTRFTADSGGSAGKIATEGTAVESTTLAACGEPDLIKLDVVGAEYDALFVARELLVHKNVVIFLELYPQNKEKLLPYLQSIGYKTEFLYPRSDGGVEYYLVSKS